MPSKPRVPYPALLTLLERELALGMCEREITFLLFLIPFQLTCHQTCV